MSGGQWPTMITFTRLFSAILTTPNGKFVTSSGSLIQSALQTLIQSMLCLWRIINREVPRSSFTDSQRYAEAHHETGIARFPFLIQSDHAVRLPFLASSPPEVSPAGSLPVWTIASPSPPAGGGEGRGGRLYCPSLRLSPRSFLAGRERQIVRWCQSPVQDRS